MIESKLREIPQVNPDWHSRQSGRTTHTIIEALNEMIRGMPQSLYIPANRELVDYSMNKMMTLLDEAQIPVKFIRRGNMFLLSFEGATMQIIPATAVIARPHILLGRRESSIFVDHYAVESTKIASVLSDQFYPMKKESPACP